MDKIYISDINILLGEKVIADLSTSDRLVIAYNALNASDITRDGKVFTISNATLQSAFENIFGTNATYATADFTVDGLSFTFVSSQDKYFAISDTVDNTRTIQSEIVDVVDENEYVVIKEVVGYVKEIEVATGTYTVEETLYKFDGSSVKDADFVFDTNL